MSQKARGRRWGGGGEVRGSGGRGDNSSAKMSSFLSRDPLSWALVAMGEKKGELCQGKTGSTQ